MTTCPVCRAEVPERRFCDQCGKPLARAPGLEEFYRWQLSLLPERLDSELVALTHSHISKTAGVLDRMKLGRGLAVRGEKQAILVLSEDLVERGARNATLARWVAEILDGTGAAGRFAAMASASGRPEFIVAYARAFASLGRPETALALFSPVQDRLVQEDRAAYVAVYAQVKDALPVDAAAVPEELRLTVADALLSVRKPALAHGLLRGVDRSKWSHRDYLKGVRAWTQAGDRVGAAGIFKEAMARFKPAEAPHLYYEYARFCEETDRLAEARQTYAQLHAVPSTRCMVDAKTRLAATAADVARTPRGLDRRLIQHRYEVLERLGFGGMGEVYKAMDKKPDMGGRFVAVKRIRGELARRKGVVELFIEEALTLLKLGHPGIMSLYDVVHEEGEVFLICQYIDGETAQQIAHREGRIEPVRCAGIMLEVCEALGEAHDKGFLHRDIKPENIMIDRRGFVKLMDFGLAGKMGIGCGTPAYMAPEQHEGRETRRSDIFSLGATLYVLLAGRMPFEGDDLRREKLAERYPPLPESVPQPLREAVAACLKADPESRPGSAQRVGAMIAKAV